MNKEKIKIVKEVSRIQNTSVFIAVCAWSPSYPLLCWPMSRLWLAYTHTAMCVSKYLSM